MSGTAGSPTSEASGANRGRAIRLWGRRILALALLGFAGYMAYGRRSELESAGRMLNDLQLWWLIVAIAFQVGSMVAFARLQRWLLRNGGVRVPLRTMVEITLAGNALSTSLPGGAAWAATWSFGQLRRRGADRVLSIWVVTVAGALASFALFVLVAVGSWIAGSTGPVASLRWLTVALAAIPIGGGALVFAASRSSAVHDGLLRCGRRIAAWVPVTGKVGHLVEHVRDRVGTVRPGPVGWVESFGLGMANWVYDAACLAACILALGLSVPWQAIVVIYALTQIAASLPITPGGLGVVEGSMTALLVGYGMSGQQALAVTMLYRIVSFWALVPIGWGAWAALEFAGRSRIRRRPHPWAHHDHGPHRRSTPELRPDRVPDRVLRPTPCRECDSTLPTTVTVDVPNRESESGKDRTRRRTQRRGTGTRA